MSRVTGKKVVSATVICLALALGLAACGSSSDSSNSSTSSGTSASNTAGSGSGAAAAAAAIKPYVGHPSAFPVTQPLQRVPKGATVAYVDCGVPICALFWEQFQGAAKTMGIKLSRVKAGYSANTVSAAFDSIVAQKPDAVIVLAINVELWKNQLEELQEANIPVVAGAIVGAESYGFKSVQQGDAQSELAGRLMADYLVAEWGSESNVVMYDTPETSYTPLLAEAFTGEMEKVCPECAVRTAHIPVATIGTTAPSTIVSDLQANPDTTVAAFATDEVERGLPAALQSAGITVKTIGYAPGPTNYQYVKEGKETAVLAVDVPVLGWTFIDQAAREMVGQELTGPEAEGISDIQFLTQKDITFDPSRGWTGYPDFAERFAKLWGVGH